MGEEGAGSVGPVDQSLVLAGGLLYLSSGRVLDAGTGIFVRTLAGQSALVVGVLVDVRTLRILTP